MVDLMYGGKKMVKNKSARPGGYISRDRDRVTVKVQSGNATLGSVKSIHHDHDLMAFLLGATIFSL
jgi:hypothetical protein